MAARLHFRTTDVVKPESHYIEQFRIALRDDPLTSKQRDYLVGGLLEAFETRINDCLGPDWRYDLRAGQLSATDDAESRENLPDLFASVLDAVTTDISAIALRLFSQVTTPTITSAESDGYGPNSTVVTVTCGATAQFGSATVVARRDPFGPMIIEIISTDADLIVVTPDGKAHRNGS